MGDWENLPLELLAQIYKFLSRRDRLSCSLVCNRWKDGLNHAPLWRKAVVYIDVDLMEPSTIFLLRDYCKYIKKLEFGLAIPHRNARYAQISHKELTKKAVRFFLILHDSYIQIHHLRIFNLFDFMSLKKITYHICRFLKNQMHLRKIIFDNLHCINYVNLLSSCMGSKATITSLDMRNCYYINASFDNFTQCMEQLSYLKTFKVDYYVLCYNLIEAIASGNNGHLENLEVIVRESGRWDNHAAIEDYKWDSLKTKCPSLKVTMIIKNVQHFGELSHYLTESIPLVALLMVIPRACGTEKGRYNFRKSINLIVNQYHRTLESVDLHLKNDGDIIDDAILMVIRRCKKLKNFIFNGYLHNPETFKRAFPGIRCFCILPNGYPERHFLNKLFKEDVSGLRNKRVQFTLLKREEQTMCTLLILN